MCLWICLSVGFESSGSTDTGRKLFGSFKLLDLGRRNIFAFFGTLGNNYVTRNV